MSPKPYKLVHRDPETGQFLSGSGGGDQAQTYDDHRVMQVQQTTRFNDATDQAAVERSLPEIDLQRNDTLSLNHDEMAELAVLRINSFRAYVDDNDFADAENFRGGMSIAINYDDMAWVNDNDIETDNIGNSDELAGRTRLDDDPRRLWHTNVTYQNADSETGQGHPWTQPGDISDVVVNFRELFGQGPLLDSNDSFVHGTFINPVNTGGNGNLVMLISWTGYFDVFEVETARRSR